MNEIDDLDDLFDQEFATSSYNVPIPVKINLGDELIRNIESEFTGDSTVYYERKKEDAALRKELAEVKSKLQKLKNPNTKVMNPQKREALAKAANEKRVSLRKRAAQIQVLLDELSIEMGRPLDSEIREKAKEEKTKKITKTNDSISSTKFDKEWKSCNPYEDMF